MYLKNPQRIAEIATTAAEQISGSNTQTIPQNPDIMTRAMPSQRVEQSDLSPEYVDIRKVNPDGSNTTYRVNAGGLSPYEQTLLRTGLFKTTDDKLSGSFTGDSNTVTHTNQALNYVLPLPNQTKAKILKTEKSTLDNKTISRTVTPTGQVTSYKGNPLQIAVGKTVDKIKSKLTKK